MQKRWVTAHRQKYSRLAEVSARPGERDQRHDQTYQDGRANQNAGVDAWRLAGDDGAQNSHRTQRRSGDERLIVALTLTPQADADGSDPGATAQDIFDAIKICWDHLSAQPPRGGLHGCDRQVRRAVDPSGANALVIKNRLRRVQDVHRQIGAGKPKIINEQTVWGLPAQLGDGDEGVGA